MSFLQRLKNQDARHKENTQSADSNKKPSNKLEELKVDVYQTESAIIIYSQLAGVNIKDVNVSIEGNSDIVIIQGRRVRPEYPNTLKEERSGEYFVEECSWNKFYRRIILPNTIETRRAEAKIKDGVLILILPLLKTLEKEKISLKVKQGSDKANQQ